MNSTVKPEHAWYGPQMAERVDEWTHYFSPTELVELEHATEQLMAHGRDILTIDKSAFVLGECASTLARVRRDLLEGRGFCLLRGLPVGRWERLKAAICFWGIGAHLGVAVSQNGKGHVLGHVKNLGLDYSLPATRGYQTSERLPFHTDYADLVGLMCLRPAKRGGQSALVSSRTVYEEMRKSRPDLVEVLRQPLYRTRWGEVGSERPPWVEVPAFNVHSQGVMTTYVRSAVRKAQLMEEVPRLTDAQVEAMDYFDALAEDDRLHFTMDFAPGDIQFVNNHWLLHSRTGYDDAEDPSQRRHLLRLWLACVDGPPFPLAATESFQGLTANGRPNGIHVPGVPFCAPLEAE